MKGLDTNILVRYIVQDDPRQFKTATALIEKEGGTFLINTIVLCELVWVLEFSYAYTRAEITGALEHLLAVRQFTVENKDMVWQAVQDYKTHKADFSDCLLGRMNQKLGCDKTISFDRGVRSLDTFEVI